MTAGLRAIGRSRLLMIERLLVHGTQIRGSGRMAPFAPARAIAHGRVVVHLFA